MGTTLMGTTQTSIDMDMNIPGLFAYKKNIKIGPNTVFALQIPKTNSEPRVSQKSPTC
jgi:hypothetical protein